jgi:hypothetical protein
MPGGQDSGGGSPRHDYQQDAISSKDVFNALRQSVLLHLGDVDRGEVGASLAGEFFSLSFAP